MPEPAGAEKGELREGARSRRRLQLPAWHSAPHGAPHSKDRARLIPLRSFLKRETVRSRSPKFAPSRGGGGSEGGPLETVWEDPDRRDGGTSSGGGER